MLKFGQKEVTTNKDFYGQRQITDIFMIDASKVVCHNTVCHNTIKTLPIQCHLMFLGKERVGVSK